MDQKDLPKMFSPISSVHSKINLKYVIICIILLILYYVFTSNRQLVPFDSVNVASQKDQFTVCSYKVPKGEFRGALWPIKDEQYFRVWFQKGKKDIYVNVAVPVNFKEYVKNSSKDWTFGDKINVNDKNIYNISKNDSEDVIKLVLPSEIDRLSFSVLKNKFDNEIIIFMNMSENIIDNGIFGYIVNSSENHICNS